MRPPRQWKRLFRLRRWDPEADVDAELRFHLEERVAELVAHGVSHEAAQAQAATEFGDVEAVRNTLVGIDQRIALRRRRADWRDIVVHDLRYAIRGLWRSPVFSLAVVATLGLGLGANAAMFSIVDRMLFRPPPLLRAPHETHRAYLATIYRGNDNIAGQVQYQRYVDLTAGTSSFARTAAFAETDPPVGAGVDAVEMPVGDVSASFFAFFDAPPVLGRYFTPAEDTPPAGTNVTVLSYPFWQTQFGGRSDALGARLQIGSLMYTVIGVAPRGFMGLWPEEPPLAYVPITSLGGTNTVKLAGESWWNTYLYVTDFHVMVERKPGVSLKVASADLTRAFDRSYALQVARNPRTAPAEVAKPRAILAPILSDVMDQGPDRSTFTTIAIWVSGVSVIVLLIACANVTNLHLARALRRRREIAVRLALGIGRGRLVSQLLTESILLAVVGGGAGMLFAFWGGAGLRATFLPAGGRISVVGDQRTLAIVGAAALIAGIAIGLAPALQALSTDLARHLKAGAGERMYRRSRLRSMLVVVQGALSTLLLIGAGLFVKSLARARDVPLGFDVTPVLTVGIRMRGVAADSAHMVALRRRLLDAATAIPSVERAALMSTIPFMDILRRPLFVAGIDSVANIGEFHFNAVSPDYFSTVGTRILRGRGISDADVASAPLAMVVSANMAKALWPGRDAVGQCVRIRADTMPCTYVVGVADNIKSERMSEEGGLFYYLSAAQARPQAGGLVVRTRGDASNDEEIVRRALQAVMSGSSYVTVTPMNEVLGAVTRSWSLGAAMFSVLGLLALIVAAIGLYSVIAYDVQQRTPEIGIRLALGADSRDLVRLIVTEGMSPGIVGVVLGGAVAIGAGRWMAPLLFEVSPRDPVVFSGVTALLLGVAAVASFGPARRASRVDPSIALRAE